MLKLSPNKTLNRILFSFIICIISLGLTVLFYNTGIQKRIQNGIYDSLFKLKVRVNDNSRKTGEAVIIPIDDHSLELMNEKGIYWPWPRFYYGMIAKQLIKEGAREVVFDMIFNNPDIDRLDYETQGVLYGADSDNAFNNVIRTGKVFICFDVEKYGQSGDSLDAIGINNISGFKNVPVYHSVLKPYSLFTSNNKNFGFAEIEADADGTIRNYLPVVKIKNSYYPALAAAVYLKSHNGSLPKDLKLHKDGTFTINWYGRGGINKTFKYVSPISVLSDFSSDLKNTGKRILPDGTFRDKVVFIGATARGLLDMKSTPFTKIQAYPGVEIQATTYLNLEYNDWIRNFNPVFEFLIYFLILFIFVSFMIDTKYPVRNSILFFGLLAVILIVHFYLFIFHNIMFQTTSAGILIFLLVFITSIATNYLLVGQVRNKIKNAFSTYISPELLNKIIDSNKPLTAYGEKVEASGMFIDIAGFTTFSEKNSVEKVVEILNLYLKKFSEAIINNGGWVNKYLGDGLMALFGALDNSPDHADCAVRAAFECYNINRELSKDYGLSVRIGVNSGPMIFGSFGADEKKLEFTAIGDSVNSTSRLEGANKFFSSNILVGESAYHLLKTKYDLNYVGKFGLKGKDIPVEVYYFIEGNEENKKKFHEMLEAYEKSDSVKFLECSKFFQNNDFGPAKFYMNHYNEHRDKFGKPVKLTEK